MKDGDPPETENYKKITPEFMDELWKKIDLDYLMTIPYPPEEGDLVKYGRELSKQ